MQKCRNKQIEIEDMVLQIENICIQACEELQEELNTIKTTTL